ncbi:MAG: guanine deaminase [Tepidanaerobacteraceae bacterium]
MKELQIFKGDIIFTPTPQEFVSLEGGYIVVSNGKVEGLYEELPETFKGVEITDFGRRLIIPAFVDLHVHAPQYYQTGVGMDKELIPWLNSHTFPLERRFDDPEFAREAYSSFVDELIRQGTLRACIYATVHKESTEILFDILASRGIGAFVGKINTDRNCPHYLKEDTSLSLHETEELIISYNDHPMVKPIVTPRFAPTSTEKLLNGLAQLARKYNVPVQSHLSENTQEIEWVKELFPSQATYADVYYYFGLLGQTPTLMAHAIHLEERELELIENSNVWLVHCPESNINLSSGIMPVRELLDRGTKLGLGSDIGAGHNIALYRVMVRAIQLSKIRCFFEPNVKPLSSPEAFYLGTKGGGSFFGKVGSFEKGFSFDALVVDDKLPETLEFSLEDRLQKFLYTGESDSIIARFLEGKRINCGD